MTPPPRTATFFGTTSSSSACSLVMTRPPMSRPGSEREYEPVARMMCLPITVSSPTCTVVGDTRRPSPSTTVMPRALISPWRPLNLLATMPSRYAVTAWMSMPSKLVLTPNFDASRLTSATSAACRSALVGMHPTCRHVPPSLPFSTRPTVKPSWAARSAAAYPPLPPPRTTTSKFCSDTQLLPRALQTLLWLPWEIVLCRAAAQWQDFVAPTTVLRA